MKKTAPTCRACGSTALHPVTFHPALSMALSSQDKSNKSALNKKARHQFFLCDPTKDTRACGLLQTVDSNKESSKLQLPSGTLRMTRDHLRSAATEALELISGRDCAALDIGCDDGTLLSYYPRWVDRFGIDPADHVNKIGDWAWSAQASFPSTELDEAFGSKSFDIITCISTLEYVDDPITLLNAIKKRLVRDGVLVLETLYAPMIMTSNNFEALTPNLTGLYSLMGLEQLVKSCDMKIFRGSLTSKEGGSIRLFITHQDNDEYDFDPWSERLAKLWDEETVLALRDIAPFQAFDERCRAINSSMLQMMRTIKKRAETVHLLGTDMQSEILLNWVSPEDKVISHIVSHTIHLEEPDEAQSPTLKGRKVISEAESRAIGPDYLLAPARLKREVLENWREVILAGGKVLFASPHPLIVDASNFSAEYGKTLSQGDSAAGVETLRAILHAAGGPRLVAEQGDMIAKTA